MFPIIAAIASRLLKTLQEKNEKIQVRADNTLQVNKNL